MLCVETLIFAMILVLLPMHKLILYIDPGSGSFLFQIIIGGILSTWFFFKTFWTRMKLFFIGKKANKLPDDNLDSDAS